jgi:NAD-dependent SIR2 family protein deacetylase
MFAPQYNCVKCGQVDGREDENIDVDRDEIYIVTRCAKCGGPVTSCLKDGKQVVRLLTDDS